MSQCVDVPTLKNDDEVSLDRILVEEVGQFGMFQLRVIALCALVALFAGLATNDYVFTFAKVNTRCLISECESSQSSQRNFTPSWLANAVPATGNSFDNCHRYPSRPNVSDSCSGDQFDRDSVIECDDYVYEDKNSAIFEFNLACDEWRPNIIGSIALFGMMVCLPITGFVADHWGRRIALSLTAFNLAWIGCLKYFADSYTSIVILTLIQNVTGMCSFSCAYIQAVEFMGPKYRVMAGVSMSTFLATGATLQGLIAWTRPYWRHLILILFVPALSTFSYFWISPESIRWLISKGRYKESEAILKKAAKLNNKVLSEKTLKAFAVNNDKEITKKDDSGPWLVYLVFKHKVILLRCIVTPVWWITALFVYYGLTLSSVGISGNKYLNYSAVNAVEIPGFWTTFLLLDRIGRKPLIIGGYWICGACQLAYIFIPNGHNSLALAVYLIGKLSISAVITAVYVYTAELYPTRHRTSLLAYSSMIGRLGAILAPLTPSLRSVIWEHLPFALFGGMAFLSGLLVFLAPETLGVALPDTMQEANDLGRHSRSSILQCLRGFVYRRKCSIS
ncbi:organic cation transporter protein-like [Choristoneura fumiferana]|uniref:organic cation transporter protein-like n=1 Tax=Choristoneura fumiferana TaxID=7141 RepID=UPI003D15D17E